MHKVVTDPKTGRMSTQNVAPAGGDLERQRREVRDFIQGNVPFHKDPNAAPKPAADAPDWSGCTCAALGHECPSCEGLPYFGYSFYGYREVLDRG